MTSPSAIRGSVAAGTFHPVLADPLAWAREVTLGLRLAAVWAVGSTLLTLGLASVGLREEVALTMAFFLTLTIITTLVLSLRNARLSRRRDGKSAVVAPDGAEATAKFSSFNVVIERDSDGYYVASVPALPGCHAQARSLDELSERIKEAIESHPEGVERCGS